MPVIVTCRTCGSTDFDLHDYRSLLMVTPDSAFFELECSQCGARVTSLSAIPNDMRSEIAEYAAQVGAGMDSREAPNR